jgi:hypothetical protein
MACDVDGDNYLSVACDGGTDCDDDDLDAHPGQTKYFDVPRKGGGMSYDYDCDGKETRETPVVKCEGFLCGYNTNVFLKDVACGQMGTYGNCDIFCGAHIKELRVERCR